MESPPNLEEEVSIIIASLWRFTIANKKDEVIAIAVFPGVESALGKFKPPYQPVFHFNRRVEEVIGLDVSKFLGPQFVPQVFDSVYPHLANTTPSQNQARIFQHWLSINLELNFGWQGFTTSTKG